MDFDGIGEIDEDDAMVSIEAESVAFGSILQT
jgi:hypothetical protein